MLHHDRYPDRKGTAGDERKETRETKRDERITETKRELDQDKDER